MQAVYNPQMQQPQYYPQLYGTSSSSMPMGGAPPYYYTGYSLQAPRGSISSPQTPTQRFGIAGSPSYLYYPTHQMEATSPSFSPYPPPPQLQPPPTRHNFPSSTTTGT